MRMPMANERKFIMAQCAVASAKRGAADRWASVSFMPAVSSSSTLAGALPVPAKSKRSEGGSSSRRNR